MMQKSFLLSWVFLLSLIAFKTEAQDKIPEIKVYESFDEIESIFHQQNDTLYVINFWATWCKPCIEELPYFEELNEKYKDEKLKVILVSLDFKKHLEKRLVPYIEKHDIRSKVVLLNDPKATYWIDRVSKDWSGVIPATLFYTQEKRIFKENEFYSLQDIESIISQF